MNITHGVYDDDEPTIKHSCKCGFDLFYFGKSKVVNQLNQKKQAILQQQKQQNTLETAYDCWNIQPDTCHLKGKTPQEMPVGLQMQSQYFDEDRRFILRYKKYIYKPYFEHLFTQKDFKMFQRALGTMDNDIICHRLCLGLMDDRIPNNMFNSLQQVVCFGDSYPPDS